MKSEMVKIRPSIYRLDDLYSSDGEDADMRRWAWHSMDDLLDCVNRQLHTKWLNLQTLSVKDLIINFALLNGFEDPSRPSLTWFHRSGYGVDVSIELLKEEILGFENTSELFVPAEWGIKVLRIVEMGADKVCPVRLANRVALDAVNSSTSERQRIPSSMCRKLRRHYKCNE